MAQSLCLDGERRDDNAHMQLAPFVQKNGAVTEIALYLSLSSGSNLDELFLPAADTSDCGLVKLLQRVVKQRTLLSVLLTIAISGTHVANFYRKKPHSLHNTIPTYPQHPILF